MLENSNKLSTTPLLDHSEKDCEDFKSRDHGIDGFKSMHAQIDTGEIQLVNFKIYDKRGKSTLSITTGDKIIIKYNLYSNTDMKDLYFGISIRNNLGVSIFNTNSYALNYEPTFLAKGQTVEVLYEFYLPLIPGNYGICLGAASGGNNLSGFDHYILNLHNVEVLEIIGRSEKPRFGGMVDLVPNHSVTVL
jgi:lipopolysaccharide transport system ATP-binding protein